MPEAGPSLNPYQSPVPVDEEVVATAIHQDAFDIRASNLPDEQTLMGAAVSLAATYVMVAALSALAIIAWFGRTNGLGKLGLLLMAGMTLLLAAAVLKVAAGVLAMAAWTRVPLLALSVVGLALVPTGTLFALLVLVILLVDSPRVSQDHRLLTPAYEALVAETPHQSSRRWLLIAAGGFVLVACTFVGVLNLVGG